MKNNKTLLQLAETRTDYEKKMLQAQRDEHAKQIAALKSDKAPAAQPGADKKLESIVKQKGRKPRQTLR